MRHIKPQFFTITDPTIVLYLLYARAAPYRVLPFNIEFIYKKEGRFAPYRMTCKNMSALVLDKSVLL